MNITTEVQDAKLVATVTIPAAEVDAAIKKAYREAAKKYRFPGFRAGKAPRPVIDSALGKEATLADATNELIGGNEGNVLNELDIVPVGEPEYQDVALCADKTDYVYTVEFTLRQQAPLSSYDPVEIELPPAGATEAEVDQQIEMLLSYQASFEDVERPIEATDFITLDIKNIAGAESIEGEGRMVVLGSGLLPEVFDTELLGMAPGETKTVSWTVGAEGEEPAEAQAEVTIKGIKSRAIPELTDELVKNSFGFDSVADMRAAVTEEIEADKASQLPQLKENRAVAALAERLELEAVDEAYEQSVFQDLAQNFLTNLQNRGMSLDSYLQQNGLSSEQFIGDLHAQADEVARESLALDALARELAFEVTEEDIDAEFANAGLADPAASKAQFQAEGRIPAVRDSIRRTKAVDWLVENAVVTEVDEAAAADEGEPEVEVEPVEEPEVEAVEEPEPEAVEPEPEAAEEAEPEAEPVEEPEAEVAVEVEPTEEPEAESEPAADAE